jgi:hypothetical protein
MNPRMPVRYLGFVARDAALGPGVACLAIAALFAFISTRLPNRPTPRSAEEFLAAVIAQFDWIVVLIATAGIVSADLSKGYYRALFSQPLNPGLYYLQRWLVGGVVVASFVPLVGLAIFVTSGVFPFAWPILLRLLLQYLLLGGLTFLLSTLLRADWLIAFLVSILETVLHGLETNGVALGALTRALARVLPPFHVAAQGIRVAPTYPSSADLTHAVLYGIGLVALAVTLLMYRPLGSGGRA